MNVREPVELFKAWLLINLGRSRRSPAPTAGGSFFATGEAFEV